MSAVAIEWLNLHAPAVVDWAWRAGLASLLLTGLLLVTRPVVKRRVSAHAASWLWLLPLVPLVAPPIGVSGLQHPIPAFPAELTRTPRRQPVASAPDSSMAATTPSEVANAPMAESEASEAVPRAEEGVAGVEAPIPDAQLTPPALAILAWCALALAGLVRVALRWLRTRRLVARSVQRADDELSRRFVRLTRQAGLDSRVQLRLTDELDSPATAGLVRGVVLLPTALTEQVAGPGLDWILRHELAHVRRRDVLVSTLVDVVRALWIFHPCAWIAPRLAERERELSCDEAALARESHADGACAADALLRVLERRLPKRGDAAGAIPLTHPRSLERERIMKLLDPSVRATRGLSAFASVCLVVVGVALLASGVQPAKIPDAQGTPVAQHAPAPRSNDLESTRPSHADLASEALAFLVAQQQPDGRWRAVARKDGGFAGEFDDVGVTGATLLALIAAEAKPAKDARVTDRLRALGYVDASNGNVDASNGSGDSEREGAIRRGLDWLARQQDESGAFGLRPKSPVRVPSHAMALQAWLAAQTQLQMPADTAAWRQRAQHAVDYALEVRNPYQGWRYDDPPTGTNDSVISSWMLIALAQARDAGLQVDTEAFQGGRMVLKEHFDPSTGRVGYDAKGAPTSRLAAKATDFPGERVEFPTATALCARLALGVDPLTDDEFAQSAILLTSKAPQWSRGEGTIDSYYWAFGTQAVQPLGGVLAARWNRALVAALDEHFDRDSEGRVFWAAVDAWHDAGSEVAMTAMCVLALQAIE